MIKAIIFDLDGTLLPSEGLGQKCLNMALKQYKIKIEDKEYNSDYKGLSVDDKLEKLYKEKDLDKKHFQEIKDKKVELIIKELEKSFKPNNNHIDLINFVKKYYNYKIAICSNTSRKKLNWYLRHCGFKVDLSLSCDDVEHTKPNPEMYLKAFDELKAKPAQTVIFEDSKPGKKAAKDAGAHIFPVKTPDDIKLVDLMQFIYGLINA